MRPLESPIILLGTHRSGTTWLGNALGQSPELAYWPEPRPVWVYKNWFRDDDSLTEADATEEIKAYIRRRFAEYVRAKGADRLCEKTPTNCFRLRFIHAVYPEARFILIVRDGRAVFRSTREVTEGGPRYARLWERLMESSLMDYPAYVSRLPWLVDKLMGRPARMWGMRPPGWREWVKNDPSEIAVAKQWTAAIGTAMRDLEAIPEEQRVTIRYEELVSDPERVFGQVQRVIQLRNPEPVLAYLTQSADAGRAAKWRSELPEELLGKIRPYMEETLASLNYAW